MKTTIEVKDRNEANFIKAALTDPTTRAAVVVIGILLGLSTPEERSRVLRWAAEKLKDDEAKRADPTPSASAAPAPAAPKS